MNLKKHYLPKCLILFLIVSTCIATASADPHILTVGEGKDHLNISDALSMANDGSIILVSDGIYNENIIVDKEVIIRSENGSANTAIHPTSLAWTVNITANNVTIEGFDISNDTLQSSLGILIISASNCTLANNDISGFLYGIVTFNTSHATLINNNLYSNHYDIFLDNSQNCLLRNNDMASTDINFGVYGSVTEDYIHDIDLTNNVNGQLLYYLIDYVDYEVPTDAGQVYAVNSQNVTIRDLVISNGLDGVALINTSNSTIENVTVSGCYDGIYLFDSEYNLIRDVTAVDNDAGIHNHNSSNNMLLNNIIRDNFDGGLYLCGSDDVALVGNRVSSNDYNGINIWKSNSSWLQDNIVQFNEDRGIEIEESNNATLIGNTVNYNSMDGIYMYGSSNSSLDDNVVNHNSGIGIRVYDLHDSTLTGNTANENARAGIYVYTSANITLTDNTADDSTGYYSIAAFEIQDIDPQSLEFVSLSEVKRHSKSTMIISDDSMSVMAFDRTSYGIRIEDSDDITLINNHATGSDYQLRAARPENLIVDNLIITEKFAGISLAGNFYDVSLSETFSVPASLSGRTNVNGYVKLSYSGYESLGINGYSGPESMDITLSYDDSGMSSAAESSISLFSLNGSTWVRVPDAILSTSNNSVSATITGYAVADLDSIMKSAPITEITLALFKDSERTGSSGSSVIAREISQGTRTSLPVGNDGELTGDTVVKSSDSSTTLTLFKGTKALDSSGNPVNSIIVTTPSSLPSDTPKAVIESGLYFRFGPAGTTFSQDVMITMEFNPEDFEGRTPVIYTYTSEGGWIALETTVDWENGRATAMISHFSFYALFGTDAEPVKEVSFEPASETTETVTSEGNHAEDSTDEKGLGFIPWVVAIVLVMGLGIVYGTKKKK